MAGSVNSLRSDSNETSGTSQSRSIHDVLGSGTVANVLLWRNRYISAAVLGVMTVIWFLFEVADRVQFRHPCLSCLHCHAVVIFIWRILAEKFGLKPPSIPKIISDGSIFRDIASSVHKLFNSFLSKLIHIANSGKDLPLAIISLYVLSMIGTYLSFLNLLYLGLLCLQTLFLYEKFLNKNPRGPVKD